MLNLINWKEKYQKMEDGVKHLLEKELYMPEYPDKFVLRLDSQQLEQYLICPLSWYYKYHESIRQNNERPKTGANKGTIIHKLLENFYKELGKNKTRSVAMRESQKMFAEQKWAEEFKLQDEVAFLNKRFFQYTAHYDDHDLYLIKDSNGNVGTEVGFAKTLYEDDKVLFIVEGRFDCIVEIASGNAWVDHKTQAKVGTIYQYCPQFLTYAWATELEWGVINYIAMHEEYDPKKTFRRQIINFPHYVVAEWEKKMLNIFWEIRNKFLDSDYLQARFWNNRNPAECAGPFKSHPCQFTTLCELDQSNTKLMSIIKSNNYHKVEPWTPWKVEIEE